MPSFTDILSAGLVVLGALAGSAVANPGCKTINSIGYCNAVDHITYSNIQGSGSYDDVVNMDPKTCGCDTKPMAYSGTMSPLDEQLSLHFRGPLTLKKFAVYYPTGSKYTKRAEKRSEFISKHHRHHHFSGDDYSTRKQQNGGLTRTAYYDSKKGIAQGLVFLNHKGGQGSGVWDMCWGNSLSYASATCDSGSSEPQVLADITLKSNTEFLIMSDEKCDGDCGYYRDGIPAYRGFDGKDKVFLFEFNMPEDNTGGFNSNMPSIWALNAKIPRTAQYGKCSCWDSGCGEFDLFEVLEDATDYVKSHYHASQGATGSYGKGGGGSPDYFDRPYGKCVKAAAIFDKSGTVTVKFLPDSVDFGKYLDSAELSQGSESASTYRVPS
ncbi:hypothetical protein K440DRAFT_607555 [Wilcoxina mikolae CBS 423.85]|nr:hypothetical protein K440DRAFT_607555 [Wilcoxina mikolae CBS 423.85]